MSFDSNAWQHCAAGRAGKEQTYPDAMSLRAGQLRS